MATTRSHSKSSGSASGIKSWPISERPREILLSKGGAALSDAQLLAVLLRGGTRGKSALSLARTILQQFGSLRKLFQSTPEELCRVNGIGPAKAAQIIAACEIGNRRLKDMHGLDAPSIDSGNSLRRSLKEIGDNERVDVILTNPPFGGEEEKGIQGNFPADKQTSETALLFLQLIMRKLRRQGHLGRKGGRAGVIVPNGTLFGDGVCARIKEECLKEFNLHTIVRLPNGVFSPYTSIPTNLLFFDRSGKTKEIWYYEHPLPEGRKNYTKTKPLQFDEFKPCLEWWHKRVENEQAWKVPAAEIIAGGFNLDRKNPRGKEDIAHLPPEQLVESIIQKEQRIMEIMGSIKRLLEKAP